MTSTTSFQKTHPGRLEMRGAHPRPREASRFGATVVQSVYEDLPRQVLGSGCPRGSDGAVRAGVYLGWRHARRRGSASGIPRTRRSYGTVRPASPEYYRKRYEIASERIAKDPSALAAYDNAAVACERLGRTDEAIDWMLKKQAAMEALPVHDRAARDDARYRFHANIGTFYAHRWVAGERSETIPTPSLPSII